MKEDVHLGAVDWSHLVLQNEMVCGAFANPDFAPTDPGIELCFFVNPGFPRRTPTNPGFLLSLYVEDELAAHPKGKVVGA